MTRPIRKAVFPVAGLGTRFLPATKVSPKEMLPLMDRPLIQHAVDEARAAGITQFIFVMGPGKESLMSYFGPNAELERMLSRRRKKEELRTLTDCRIEDGSLITVEQTEPLGLGHAIWCAKEIIGDEPFAIMLPDDVFLSDTPCLQQMIQAYDVLDEKGHMMAVTDVPNDEISRYGVIKLKGTNKSASESQVIEIDGMVEKPSPSKAPSSLAIVGRYIVSPEIFVHLDKAEKGAGGEIQLTDALEASISTTPTYGYRFDGKRYDCGHQLGLLEANLAFTMARPDMAAGMNKILMRLASA